MTSSLDLIPLRMLKASVDGPCFPVFSRAFKHPPDHGPRQDPVVMQRFREHGQWFPLFNYEENALLRKKDQWKVPNSSERAQIMGIPPAALKWAPRTPRSETQAEQVRCSLIGNSFHVPSCMLALIMLFQLCPQASAIPPAAYVGLEKHIRQNAQDSVWQPGLVDNFPGVLGWTELARLTSRSLAPSGVVLPDLCPSPGLNVALAKLQVYWVDTQMRGLPAAPQGPEWRQQSRVAASKQAVGLQGAGPNAKHASPPLLPPGLGKSTHMQFATCLPNPFDTAAQLDDDSLFACRGMCTLGPCIRVWRQQQLRALSRLAKFMRPWDEAICKAMHPDVAAVAKDRKPAFITALTHLLRWPDDTVGLRFFTGFKLLGAIESPGLFRPLDDEVPPPQLGLSALLGKHAADVTLKVESCLPRFPFAAEAKAITQDEVRDGLAAGPFTKSQLDSLFGPGNWIPMRRFMLLQANKLRAIDDGRFSGHNKSCFSEETIYTISPDFVAAACKFCSGLLQDLEGDLPMWAEPHFGTEDMKAAYRQLPNDPDEQAGLFIAFYDPDDQQVKYVHLRAHPFGLSAAVLNFNRVPCLSTAVVRRLAAVAACNYFDDFGVLDFVCARGSGVSFLREAHNLMGLVLDAVKQGPMATQRHFLGILLDLTAALDKQILRINLKVGLREALRADIQVMLDQDQCTAAEAAKLRGRLTWAACGMFGRCGRAGQAALVQRQYRDSESTLSDELRASLRFFQSLVQVVEPRTVFLGPRALPPLIVYTDASWEPQEMDSPGLGFVLSHPDLKQCHSGATKVPAEVLQCLQDRKTQIMPLEALAILQCFVVFGSRFTGRDILLFVDNQAVCAGVAKGACSSADCARIISACHLLWAKMGCRVWIEWIPSDDNPSDGLSRAGLQDPWTVSQNWWMAEFPCVPWAQLQLLDLLLVPDALVRWSATLDVSEGEKGSETV